MMAVLDYDGDPCYIRNVDIEQLLNMINISKMVILIEFLYFSSRGKSFIHDQSHNEFTLKSIRRYRERDCNMNGWKFGMPLENDGILDKEKIQALQQFKQQFVGF